MTLTQLEYLLAVEKHLHFGKAAEECRVSQPSLSVQIQKVEEELGIKIFERTKNYCRITDAGAEVLKQARVVVDETKRINDIVADFKSEVKGKLRLGIIPTVSSFLIPHFVPHLGKKYPNLKLEIYEQKTTDLVKLIEDANLDAAILSTPQRAPETLREKILYYEPFLFFSSKSHPLHKISTLRINYLEEYAPQLLDDTHCMRDQVMKLCQLKQEDNLRIQMKSGTLQTLVEVVKAVGSYTLLPALSRPYFEKTHPGCIREFKDPRPFRKLSLVFHRSFLKRPLIEALAKAIQEHLPSEVTPIIQKSKNKVIDPDPTRF